MEKGWMKKKEEDHAEERERAFKELEQWEMRLRKARTAEQKSRAEARIEYWKTISVHGQRGKKNDQV